ncbi:MAG TPA: ABC transporter permease, partial [Acidimicrobiia bacterium]|jgi:ABC-type branched-subunit amino acid transport system permease subunit
VPNVAFVAIGTVAAVLHWDLATPEGLIPGDLNWWPALGVALVAAAGLGMVTDLLVRTWRGRTQTALVVLLGWTAALLAGANAAWGSAPKLLPGVWPGPPLALGDVAVPRQQLGSLLLATAALVVVAALYRRTRFGLALRAHATDCDAARMMGMDPGHLSMAAWAVSSLLAGLAAILVAHPVLSSTYEQTVYVPFAFGAALLGGFRSLTRAGLGALVLGVVPTLLEPSGSVRLGGVRTLVAFLIVALLLWKRPGLLGRLREPDEPSEDWAPAAPGGPLRLPRGAGRVALLLAAAILVVAVPAFSGDLALAAWVRGISVFLVCASIVVMTGWTGQVAIGQVAFAGFSAFMAANLATRLGVPHVLAIPLAALLALPLAVVAGLPALRARGRLPFAMVSVGLAVVASSFMWGPGSHWFAGGGTLARPDWMVSLAGRPAVSLYLLALALAAGVVWFTANLRRSRVGRTFAAVRDAEEGAASLGIDPLRYRLAALAFSAVVAGLGGVVYAYLAGTIDPTRFAAFLSLQYLLYAVVGGVGSLVGTGVVVFAFEVLPALDGGGPGPEVVAVLGLLAVAAVPLGGLAGLARRVAVATGRAPADVAAPVGSPDA